MNYLIIQGHKEAAECFREESGTEAGVDLETISDRRAIRDAIEKHETASQSYMEEGITILELAQRAPELFEKQEARETRRLLNSVLSNCTWDGEKLVPEFRQPFDMIADAATACTEKEAVGGSSDDLCQLMGG